MAESLHHVHIFARDIDATIAWWRDMLGGELIYDGVLAGSRNVFMRIGSGGLHLYDQPPRDEAAVPSTISASAATIYAPWSPA